MKSLFKRSGFLIKSLALGLFLMTASTSNSIAQYIQIEVRYDPLATTDPMPYIMEMKVYSDAACTTPTTYNGIVTFRTGSGTFEPPSCVPYLWNTDYNMTISDFNSANFLYYGIRGIPQEADCGHVEDNFDHFWYVIAGPNSGYQLATVPEVFI